MHWRIISRLRCGVRRAALLKRLINAEEGDCSSLMRAAASEMSLEHV